MSRKPYLHRDRAIKASTSRESVYKSPSLLEGKEETVKRLTERHGRDTAMRMMKVKTLVQFKEFIAALR